MKRAISDNNIIVSETIALRSVSDQYNGINVDRMISSRSFSPDFFPAISLAISASFLTKLPRDLIHPGTRRQ